MSNPILFSSPFTPEQGTSNRERSASFIGVPTESVPLAEAVSNGLSEVSALFLTQHSATVSLAAERFPRMHSALIKIVEELSADAEGAMLAASLIQSCTKVRKEEHVREVLKSIKLCDREGQKKIIEALAPLEFGKIFDPTPFLQRFLTGDIAALTEIFSADQLACAPKVKPMRAPKTPKPPKPEKVPRLTQLVKRVVVKEDFVDPIQTKEDNTSDDFLRQLKEARQGVREPSLQELYNSFQRTDSRDSELVPSVGLTHAFNLYLEIQKVRDLLSETPREILSERIIQLKRRSSDEYKVQYFALSTELFQRIYGFYPYNLQTITALLFCDTKLRQLPDGTEARGIYGQVRTGEGKSLLNALIIGYQGMLKPSVDVLTVNLYLARRDQKAFEPFLTDQGLLSGVLNFYQRENIFRAPPKIIFTSGVDLIFHTLAAGKNLSAIFRGRQAFSTAIVDEADLTFLPHVNEICRISEKGTAHRCERLVGKFPEFVSQYGEQKVESDISTAVDEFTRFCPEMNDLSRIRIALYLQSALQAKHVKQGIDYVIKDKEVVIVDKDNTGRLQKTHWLHGLGSFVAMQHGLPTTAPSRVSAEMSSIALLDRYRYGIFCVTGTVGSRHERAEVKAANRLISFDIPPLRPSLCRREGILLTYTSDEWLTALTRAAISRHRQAPAIAQLYITESIEKSILVRDTFRLHNMKPQLLNDFNNSDSDGNPASEETIVSKAGRPGAITIATSVAGRGTDICPDTAVLEAGGLEVILTRFTRDKRLQDQEEGRTARQGNPGMTRMIICVEDSTFFKSLPSDAFKHILEVAKEFGPASIELATLLDLARECREVSDAYVRKGVYRRQLHLQSLQEWYFSERKQLTRKLAESNPLIKVRPQLASKLITAQINPTWSTIFDEHSTDINYFDTFRQATVLNDVQLQQASRALNEVCEPYLKEQSQLASRITSIRDIYFERMQSILQQALSPSDLEIDERTEKVKAEVQKAMSECFERLRNAQLPALLLALKYRS